MLGLRQNFQTCFEYCITYNNITEKKSSILVLEVRFLDINRKKMCVSFHNKMIFRRDYSAIFDSFFKHGCRDNANNLGQSLARYIKGMHC